MTFAFSSREETEMNLCEAGAERGFFDPEIVVAQNEHYPRQLFYVADLKTKESDLDGSWVIPGETYVLNMGDNRYSVLKGRGPGLENRKNYLITMATNIVDFDLALEIADAMRDKGDEYGS